MQTLRTRFQTNKEAPEIIGRHSNYPDPIAIVSNPHESHTDDTHSKPYAAWLHNLSSSWPPPLPTSMKQFSDPHLLQTLASIELSFSILTNAASHTSQVRTPIWLLKHWAAVLWELLAAAVSGISAEWKTDALFSVYSWWLLWETSDRCYSTA